MIADECAMNKTSLLALWLFPLLLTAQNIPHFEVDPSWPKPLPESWITGQLGGVCTDSHDHIVVVNRRDITAEEAETAQQAPSIIMFDLAGNVVASWGDTSVVPNSIHGCAFDKDNNVWVGGNNDGVIQKYSHEGKLLTQIGKRGVFDTSDGTSKGKSQNSSPAISTTWLWLGLCPPVLFSPLPYAPLPRQKSIR